MHASMRCRVGLCRMRRRSASWRVVETARALGAARAQRGRLDEQSLCARSSVPVPHFAQQTCRSRCTLPYATLVPQERRVFIFLCHKT